MAQPSSSHREHRDRDREVRASDRDRERDRERRSSRSHHHHRTISSTTLLLVLSLVLAVLAVMLSLPSNGLPPIGGADPAGGPADSADPQKGVWGILTPKRSQALVQRESQVASREADVARREAELLAGAPGGVLPPPPTPPVVCQVCPTIPAYTAPPPAETIYKEIVTQTEALTPPGWFKEGQMRFEDILDRELKIADREREIGRREESVNRREHDASRREAWIMEQLMYALSFFHHSLKCSPTVSFQCARRRRTPGRRRGGVHL